MTDLTDRMRTCAAYMLKAATADERDAGTEFALNMAARDAADLLIEASDELELWVARAYAEGFVPAAERGEPMEVIEPSHTLIPPTIDRNPSDLWIAPGGPLPGLTRTGTISPRACPKCDSRAVKRVRRAGSDMMLICPVCSHEWPYQR